MKTYIKILLTSIFLFSFTFIALALTKPGPDTNVDDLSYVFYFYYDKGQLFADRDYEVKFDIVNEKFVAETPAPETAYRADIFNFKSALVKTFNFDPRKGNINFSGKVQIKGPYVSDGSRVAFFNNRGEPILNIFVSGGAICNDDGMCTSSEGENEKTCKADCAQAKPSRTIQPPPPILDEGPDLTMILIYSFGGLGIAVGAWFGWKQLKKRRGENFLPPPPPPSSNAPLPPLSSSSSSVE